MIEGKLSKKDICDILKTCNLSNVKYIKFGELEVTFCKESSSLNYEGEMSTVRAPIHAATAMLTATVTAMSMIDATTGLRALSFFLIFLNVFIFLFYPSFGIDIIGRLSKQFKSYDLIHHINFV